MSIKTRVQDIFDRFQIELAVNEPTQLASAKLESGQEIQTDAESFASGAAVFVTNDEGEKIPLPDGNYTMEDGSSFTVKDGVIAEEDEEEPTEETPAPAEDEDMSQETEMSQEDARQALQDALRPMVESMIKDALAPMMESLSATEKKLETLSVEPAGPSVPRAKMQKKTPDPVDLKNLSVADRVKAIQAQFMNHG